MTAKEQLLPFISDEDLTNAVKHMIDKARSAMEESKIDKNVLDPFCTLFEFAGFSYDKEKWLKSEKTRQSQKTLSNAVGAFHQQVISCIEGWKIHSSEVIDVSNSEMKIIAEIKNKHNTTKGSDKVIIYKYMESLIAPKTSTYKGYKGYYVEIIPKKAKRYDEPFTPSDKKSGTRCAENPNIRVIDGASFYALASGVDDALQLLFHAIPTVVKSLDEKDTTMSEKNLEFLSTLFSDAYVPKPKPEKKRKAAKSTTKTVAAKKPS